MLNASPHRCLSAQPAGSARAARMRSVGSVSHVCRQAEGLPFRATSREQRGGSRRPEFATGPALAFSSEPCHAVVADPTRWSGGRLNAPVWQWSSGHCGRVVAQGTGRMVGPPYARGEGSGLRTTRRSDAFAHRTRRARVFRHCGKCLAAGAVSGRPGGGPASAPREQRLLRMNETGRCARRYVGTPLGR